MDSFYLWWVAEVGHPPSKEAEYAAFHVAYQQWLAARAHSMGEQP